MVITIATVVINEAGWEINVTCALFISQGYDQYSHRGDQNIQYADLYSLCTKPTDGGELIRSVDYDYNPGHHRATVAKIL